MPTFTGTSNVGLIVIGPVRTNAPQWVSLEILQTDINSQKDRRGLMLCGFLNPGGSLRVVETFKIFGGGLFVLPRWPLDTVIGRIAIDWYRVDLDWQLDVPFGLT